MLQQKIGFILIPLRSVHFSELRFVSPRLLFPLSFCRFLYHFYLCNNALFSIYFTDFFLFILLVFLSCILSLPLSFNPHLFSCLCFILSRIFHFHSHCKCAIFIKNLLSQKHSLFQELFETSVYFHEISSKSPPHIQQVLM